MESEKMTELTAQIKALTSKVAELTAQDKALTSKVAELTARNKALTSENTDLKYEVKELNEKLDDEKSINERLRGWLTRAEKALRRETGLREEMRKNVDVLRRLLRNARRNVSDRVCGIKYFFLYRGLIPGGWWWCDCNLSLVPTGKIQTCQLCKERRCDACIGQFRNLHGMEDDYRAKYCEMCAEVCDSGLSPEVTGLPTILVDLVMLYLVKVD